MFEQYKLNKYNKKIIGFAYYRYKIGSYYEFQIFLVVKDDDEYKFVKFKRYKVYEDEEKGEIKKLLSQGYQPLSYYFDKSTKRDKAKSLNLKRIK